MDFCNEISLSSFILTFYRISIYDLWFIGNAVVNSWKRDGILTTSSLSLSLSSFFEHSNSWNLTPRSRNGIVSMYLTFLGSSFLQKPINAPDACLHFPLVRDRGGILFEIKMKNCEYSVSIYFSSAIPLSLSFYLKLFETQTKEYLKKKKKKGKVFPFPSKILNLIKKKE